DMTHDYLLIVVVCVVLVGLSALLELVPFKNIHFQHKERIDI
ncbi:MFS transporter, partial [Bacillus inaquosorum]|nr:MFS transporter [Bacillus inaquosorum]